MTDTKRQHFSHEAETAVLGGVALNPAFLKRLDELEVRDFHHPRHQAVWQAIRACETKGDPIDRVTILNRLGDAGKAEMVGGDGGLAMILFAGPATSIENVQHYAKIMQSHRVVRDLRVVLGECIAALDDTANADDSDFEGAGAVQWVQRQVSQIKPNEADDGTIGIGKLCGQRVKQLEQIAEERATGKRTLTGITSGVTEIDNTIGGVQVGIITIVAARPAMGKSSLLRVITSAASKAGYGSHTFSVEDLRERFADRTISGEANVPAEALRTCNLNRAQMSDIGNALARLYQRQNWLVDDRSLTALEVVRAYRRHGEENKTKVVAVDYLQRLRKRDYRMSDFEHVSESMDILADAFKQDGVAGVVGSQLNRECEKRDNKRPQLADMRAGGPIEEIAKCIIGMYRGVVYGDPVEGEDYNTPGAPQGIPSPYDWERQCELILLKNSDGKTGRLFVEFNGETTSIR
jgi:replicative DNA helicase